MEIPYSRWYAAIEKRRSRRKFDARPLDAAVLTPLQDCCREFRPFPGVHTALVTESTESVFEGAIGGYGKVRDAPAFIAVIADTRNAAMNEAAGFTGQGIVLEATSLGLDTCWVAMFRKTQSDTLVELENNERILAVIPVGHSPSQTTFEEKVMTGFGRTHQRRPLEEMATGLENAPGWAREAVSAARLAPSAVNRQPWMFELDSNTIDVSVKPAGADAGISRRVDCGIAMLHIEVTAGHLGKSGSWQLLDDPMVARFTATA